VRTQIVLRTRIIPDELCDAPMLRGKLKAIRQRALDARLMLENSIPAAVEADPTLQLAKRLRWTLDHLEEPLERSNHCYHLADSDEPGDNLEPDPCPKCGLYYCDD
jgi:hypothetical protein